MSHNRLTTWQKATALVPLALLSGAWTTSLAATGTATAAAEGQTLPDGSTIPDQAIEAPASVSRPGEIAPGVPAGAASSVISSASTNGIPSAALSAYQRASEVINSADPTCKLEWQLIAAIGRVESDHGRYGGNTLSADGKSVPGIYGIPLDGSNGTARITDTDAGQYDNDQVYDRAVGPMQFIPATWSVVGVDADGDDVRDPQDLDDAALASAVYLCSGNENLSTVGGQRSSVYRYNHSEEYVDLVLSIMSAYLGGDYASVPNGAAAPTVFAPRPDASGGGSSAAGKKTRGTKNGSNSGGSNSGGSGGSGGGTGSTGGSDGGTTDRPDPSTPKVPSTPDKDPTKPVDDATDDPTAPVEDTVTPLEKATAYCNGQLSGTGASGAQVQDCVSAYVNGGKPAADSVIAVILSGLGGLGGDTGGLLD